MIHPLPPIPSLTLLHQTFSQFNVKQPLSWCIYLLIFRRQAPNGIRMVHFWPHQCWRWLSPILQSFQKLSPLLVCTNLRYVTIKMFYQRADVSETFHVRPVSPVNDLILLTGQWADDPRERHKWAPVSTSNILTPSIWIRLRLFQ